MKHIVHMLFGCVLPFLLIFLLPLFGVSQGMTLTVFIVLMFGCHLFMTPIIRSCRESSVTVLPTLFSPPNKISFIS